MGIEVLLKGAEKLNDVYSIPGVPERIKGLRTRYGQYRIACSIMNRRLRGRRGSWKG